MIALQSQLMQLSEYFLNAWRSKMTLKLKAANGAPISQVIQPGQAHFAMVEKAALYNLDELMRKDMQAARLIVSLIRLMEPGSGGVVVISRASMAELLGVSLPTVQRALKTLVDGCWVHRIKIGGAYALAVNKAVAWVGPRGQLSHAVFSATVIASRSEQDAAGLNPGQLRQIPTALPGEAVLPYGNEPDPPSQPGLDGIPHAVATQGLEVGS
ncbi:hypothetical protein CLU88_4559 [Acidovorax sp. 56]|uniref:helix-turn-helix domain-containing protein n=1 Tax=Acidovorax sp. 56 TaxID=2035205 RepID=UPI000C3CF651|nr:helix-turn-helix domain-containing protein [Acidovorax sp. 56]PIF25184.1 hypothetical protein CLU88_4559 [Acidovorax sp. 56]